MRRFFAIPCLGLVLSSGCSLIVADDPSIEGRDGGVGPFVDAAPPAVIEPESMLEGSVGIPLVVMGRDFADTTSIEVQVEPASCYSPGDTAEQETVVSRDGEFAARMIELVPCAELAEGDSGTITVSLSGGGCLGDCQEESLSIPLRGLDELVTEPTDGYAAIYSRIQFEDFAPPSSAWQLRATHSIRVNGFIAAQGGMGGVSSAGPGGNSGGTGTNASDGAGPGGGQGGVSDQGGGGATRDYGSEPGFDVLIEGGSGGGRGGGANGLEGGGGGGVVVLEAPFIQFSEGAMVSVAGASGASGSPGSDQCGGGGGGGGFVVVRSQRAVTREGGSGLLPINVGGGFGGGLAGCSSAGGLGASGHVRLDVPEGTDLPPATVQRFFGPMWNDGDAFNRRSAHIVTGTSYAATLRGDAVGTRENDYGVLVALQTPGGTPLNGELGQLVTFDSEGKAELNLAMSRRGLVRVCLKSIELAGEQRLDLGNGHCRWLAFVPQ